MRFRAPDETDQLLPPENSRSVHPIYGFVTERRYRLSFNFRRLGRLASSCAITRTLGNVCLIPETKSASRRFQPLWRIAEETRPFSDRGLILMFFEGREPNERFLLVLLRDDLPLTAPSPHRLVRRSLFRVFSSSALQQLVSTGCRFGQDSFRSSPRERRRTFESELSSIDRAPS